MDQDMKQDQREAKASRESLARLSFVVPVLNESEAVTPFINELSRIFSAREDLAIEIVFINDGSTDQTLETLLQHQRVNPAIRIVDLSRNFGKEAALTAGLKAATGQMIVPMDVDLQDPPEAVLQMVEAWREGFEVVLGRRVNRATDTWAKRTTASWFYRLHNKIAIPKIPENVGDFRLMDRQVVEALLEMPESCRFMKGLFAWIGFRTTTVDYIRQGRIAGQSKFGGWKLWNFALEGLTSFSTDLLRIWTYLGALIALTAFGFALFIMIRVLIQGVDVPGYASTIVAVTFLGGLQLMGIGILGEYLGRTYIESKRRPIYVIRRIYEADS